MRLQGSLSMGPLRVLVESRLRWAKVWGLPRAEALELAMPRVLAW